MVKKREEEEVNKYTVILNVYYFRREYPQMSRENKVSGNWKQNIEKRIGKGLGGDGQTVVLKREEAGYGGQGQPKLLLTFKISLGHMKLRWGEERWDRRSKKEKGRRK